MDCFPQMHLHLDNCRMFPPSPLNRKTRSNPKKKSDRPPTLHTVAARPAGALGRLEALANAVDVVLFGSTNCTGRRVGHQGGHRRRRGRSRRDAGPADAGPVPRLGTVRGAVAPLGPRRPAAG